MEWGNLEQHVGDLLYNWVVRRMTLLYDGGGDMNMTCTFYNVIVTYIGLMWSYDHLVKIKTGPKNNIFWKNIFKSKLIICLDLMSPFRTPFETLRASHWETQWSILSSQANISLSIGVQLYWEKHFFHSGQGRKCYVWPSAICFNIFTFTFEIV